MIIPGFLVSIATFPGVITHEVAHMLFCKWRKIAVLDVCFFRFGNPAGYVVHEQTDDFMTSFLISIGPFIVNSLLCIIICFPAYLPVRFFGVEDPLSYFLLWLGLSIGMHAFPSNQDASNLYKQAKIAVRTGNPLALVSFPLVLLIYIANISSIVWADLAYGIALGIGLPALLF
ncbi:MAG TPA: metalloprotease family protein [Candidatus Hydrogenedentes bacterium]|nr:metalloprotease family protein [Candidatus Hydrogenedentota bacterium]